MTYLKDIKNNNEVKELCEAVTSLQTSDECFRFLADALTPREILNIAQRLTAAKMLKAGKSYSEVSAATGMSTATISRVSKALDRGEGGYSIILKRIGEVEND